MCILFLTHPVQDKDMEVILHEESKISVPFTQSLESSGVESVLRGLSTYKPGLVH